MNLLYPFTAVTGESVAKTIDKLNYRKNHIQPRQLIFLVFSGMFVSILVYIIATKKHFPAITLISIGLIALIGVVSFLGNVFDYISLKSDDLSLREPMLNFVSVLAGLIGYVLFPQERKIGFLIAFILGAVIVYYGTHQRHLGRVQKKGMFYLTIAVVFYALLPSIYKVTLAHISPAYIAFFRVAVILALTSIFLPVKNLRLLSSSKVSYGLSSGFIYAVETVASLYAIQKLGVVETMLLFLLGPALMYLTSYFILREKVRKGEVISSLLLAGVVLITLVT
jgi:drug/metabolite transporter (DMT)-like permease